MVKLQAETCKITKSFTPPWAFLMFFKLHKWYQIAQSVSYLQTVGIFEANFDTLSKNSPETLLHLFISFFYSLFEVEKTNN